MARPSIEFAKDYFDQGVDKIVEVGVLGGGHASSMYEALNPKEMYLIDSYVNVIDGERFDDNRHQEWCKQVYYSMYLKQVENWKFILKPSREASLMVPDNLDLVYIDAGHDELSVAVDIACWFPKLRVGGILCGHDFSLDEANGVHKAVFRFFKKEKINTEEVDWWIIKNSLYYDEL